MSANDDNKNPWILVTKKKKKRKNKNAVAATTTYTNTSTVASYNDRPYCTDRNRRHLQKKKPVPRRPVHTSKSGIPLSQLEEHSDIMNHKQLRKCVQKAIIAARCNKKYSRTQLAQQIHVRVSIINDYESGNPIPDNKILQKLQKVLRVKLLGKTQEIGHAI